ncbi:MAG: MarR family winged helix-turn-helix transcriptional regulator [Steroidobacter sp.]
MAANPGRVAQRRSRSTPAPYYTADTYAAEDSVGYLIAVTRTRMFRALDTELGRLGFTSAQWPILRAVADGDTPTAADLCRRLNYDTGSMTRMLNRLEEKGVIVREPAKDDRRIVRLRMTAAGRKIYPKLREAAIRMLNDLVAGFSASEVKQAHELLRRMNSNMDYVNDADP